jgi:hypothetical protein
MAKDETKEKILNELQIHTTGMKAMFNTLLDIRDGLYEAPVILTKEEQQKQWQEWNKSRVFSSKLTDWGN